MTQRTTSSNHEDLKLKKNSENFLNSPINSINSTTKILNQNQDCDGEVEENDPLNLSGNCIKSIDLEEEKNLKETEIEEKEKSFKLLLEENILLKKENEILLEKINSKNYEISKISYEKYSLFCELQELTTSLEVIDLKKLNNFYLSNMENLKDFKKNISSFMGIKFNIMSANSKIAFDSMVCLSSPRISSQNKKKDSNDYLSSQYIEVLNEKVKKYEIELDKFIDSNIREL